MTNSILEVTDSKIRSAVADSERNLSTQIEQTANGITLNFNGRLDAVNDRVDTIQDYILFEGGNIILGEAASEIKLVIESDKIGIYNGDTVITQWNTNEILSPRYLSIPTGGKLRLGNFEFQPRQNGSLDFTWVGG